MKNKRILWMSLIVAVVLVFAGMGFSLFMMMNQRKNINKADDDGNIVKDNVKVITKDEENQPIAVNDVTIVFDRNPKYRVGDVIVSDVIDAAPNGFIRKVVSIDKENGQYIVTTEYATLMDVFEEAHVDRVFELSEDGAKEVDKSVIPELHAKASRQANDFAMTSSGENYVEKNMTDSLSKGTINQQTLMDFSLKEKNQDNNYK